MKRLMTLLLGFILPIFVFAQTTDSLDEEQNIWLIVGMVIFVLCFVIGIITLVIGLYVLVAKMAERRNRSAVAWLIVAFLGSPLLAIILLLCLGEANDSVNWNRGRDGGF